VKQTRVSLLAVQLLVVTILGGCALLPVKSSEESLRERVSLYMQARVDEQWSNVYEFFDPAYRKEVSKEEFLSAPARFDFRGYSIDTIEIAPSEKEATVRLKVDISVQGFEFKGTPERQQWIKDGRTWYIKQVVPKQGGRQETPFGPIYPKDAK